MYCIDCIDVVVNQIRLCRYAVRLALVVVVAAAADDDDVVVEGHD